MPPRQRQRTGRRPGASGTREAIAAAAQRRFAELGYDRATIRGIAEEAGVDPALVAHFFGSKQELFVTVMELPFVPEERVRKVLSGPREEAGRRLAEFVVGMLESPVGRNIITGIIRSAASEPEAARMVREQVAGRMIAAIAAELGTDDADVRASLISSQVIGLALARYVVGVEPLASLGREQLAAWLAPNFQRYLTEPLEGG